MLKPTIPSRAAPEISAKTCQKCTHPRPITDFARTKSIFFKDGFSSVCNPCIAVHLAAADWSWDAVNKICQLLDIPFIPTEFERLRESGATNAFASYAKIMQEAPFGDLGWVEYFKEFSDLKQAHLLENELPLIREKRFEFLREEWGSNYDEEELLYLNMLYTGLQNTQNINGALQTDQARKLCKISLAIDIKIRAGEDFDKLMSSYDKMIKTAEFTPKNVKNENNIDSLGEAVVWLEKRGWVNTYFDDVSRDLVDEVISNTQNFNQRLYTEESGIGEEITSRINALKIAQNLENGGAGVSNYDIDLDADFDYDKYDNAGFEELHNESFNTDDLGGTFSV